MSKIVAVIKETPNFWLRFMVVILTIATIVFLIPKNQRALGEFEEGELWLEDDFYAPFDFSIRKSDEEIELEKLEIEEEHLLFFEKQFTIKEDVERVFIEAFDHNWEPYENDNEEKAQALEKSVFLLDSIYGIGIIERTEFISADSNALIHVMENRNDDLQDFRTFLSLQEVSDISSTYISQIPQGEMVINLLNEQLRPNILFNKDLTEKSIADKIQNIALTYGFVRQGEKIVSKGERISPDTFKTLFSLQQEYAERGKSNQNNNLVTIGILILISSVIAALTLYLHFFKNDITHKTNHFMMLVLLILLTVAMSALPLYISEIPVYALPYCLLPLMLKNFFDSRIAAYSHSITILIVALLVPSAFQFVFIQVVAGMITVYSSTGLKRRSQALWTSLILFISYSTLFLGFILLRDGTLSVNSLEPLYWFVISALLTLLTGPLTIVFEKLFKVVSELTLVELSDTNTPLLRKLAEQAPGTFQHSLQVANLAEEAIRLIGGDVQLIRAGALYHDIGKMTDPFYFIENQSANYNPHKELSPTESAKKIIKHVSDGVSIAEQEGLPKQLIDFIKTHHGTSQTAYFLYQAKEENPDIDVEDFTYPGPKPYTKEMAVLMMADSVEAAAKSMKNPNLEEMNQLVENIVAGKQKSGQFDEADITFKEITLVKNALKKRLQTIYHLRVEYPKNK